MISGDRIQWNAVAVGEVTKTSWQTGNAKMKEELGNPFLGHACFVRVRNFWEDFLIAEIEELEKLDASKAFPED